MFALVELEIMDDRSTGTLVGPSNITFLNTWELNANINGHNSVTEMQINAQTMGSGFKKLHL